jgi:hypothetical protein
VAQGVFVAEAATRDDFFTADAERARKLGLPYGIHPGSKSLS